MKNENYLLEDIQKGVKIGKKVAKGAKKVLQKVAGYKDDKYNQTKNKVVKILTDAGYPIGKPAPELGEYSASAKDAPNRAQDFTGQYKNLMRFTQAVLNYYSPSLGDKFISDAPFRMLSPDTMDGKPIEILRQLVTAYAPGTYKPTFEQKAKAQIQAGINQSATTSQVVTKSQIENQNVKVLKPLAPVMAETLRSAGVMPSNDVAELSDQFYEQIVVPASQTSYESDHLDDAITNAILEFVGTIQAKKIAGEKLPPVYDKLAGLSLKLQENLGKQIQTQAGNKIGNWIVENPLLAVGGAILLGIVVVKLVK